MAYCYFNGTVIPVEDSVISPTDIGFLRGYGVFEVIRTFGKRPFLLQQHLTRLQKSAAFMNIRPPVSDEGVSSAITELIQKNDIQSEAQIRIVLTGGQSKDSITFSAATPTFIILVTEFTPPSKEAYERGISLVTVEHQRQFPQIKTLDYLKAVREWPEVKVKGAFELLYTSGGNILECTTSNIFVVKSGALATPKENVLLGTTRNYVIELAAKNAVPVEERAVPLDELLTAEEVFLTATNKDIVPVVKVDLPAQAGGHTIGAGAPGPVTKRLIELFYGSVEQGL